jgi:hypothetical protein
MLGRKCCDRTAGEEREEELTENAHGVKRGQTHRAQNDVATLVVNFCIQCCNKRAVELPNAQKHEGK